ncbi:MAG: hypothetical protein AMJ75_07870 [Phycisphaerae bacterium SM1_79]|nr:MAG: hypothetical protein AMJ75_07870 [Phycisphaerae bacterium SM1_79]
MIRLKIICYSAFALLLVPVLPNSSSAGPPEKVQLYGIHEVTFSGPKYGPLDNPLLEVNLTTEWRHESGRPTYRILGFWDSDGRGGASGNVYKVRFCPTKPGKWTLVKTTSNKHELNGQREGHSIVCVSSSNKGFWEVDPDAARGRWYRRSDGSHPYIVGNTMYSFLSEHEDKGPTGGNIAGDIRGNSRYFKKVRFSITGDRYPHPKDKPFLDNSGKPTDNGDFSHRPNVTWFYRRVDLAVREAYDHDLAADLILNGPDTRDSRSVLSASENNGDCTPILKYIAARYGSYPNVWICLANEFDIKDPKYTPGEIAEFGRKLREFLPYPTPLSVHSRSRDWNRELTTDPPWNDHVTLQKKIKELHIAADFVARNFSVGGANKPVIDDELAYEGKGDGWSEADVIEAHLGAFLGGGYGTTGHKPASKRGHYFHGNFKASEHKSADNLQWLRRMIDEDITFWKMAPVRDSNASETNTGIFQNVDREFRAMEWPGHEYVLGTNKARRAIRARLPEGLWQVTRYDVIRKNQQLLSPDTDGAFTFDAPDSRAVLFHFKRKD